MPRTNSLKLAARWLDRSESRADHAARIASFLHAAGEIDATLSTWLLQGLGTSSAFRRADVSPRGIEDLLFSRGQDPGYSVALSNGLNASFQATVGLSERRNSAILSFQEAPPRDASVWRELMSAAIEAFEPDTAMVTTHSIFGRPGHTPASEWFTYHRGGPVTENPFSPTDVR